MGRSRRNERREMSREALMLKSSIMNTEASVKVAGSLFRGYLHLSALISTL